jgi:hypothetical protein
MAPLRCRLTGSGVTNYPWNALGSVGLDVSKECMNCCIRVVSVITSIEKPQGDYDFLRKLGNTIL